MSSLIDQIKERARDPKLAADEIDAEKDSRGGPPSAVHEALVDAAEKQFGFHLPAVLRELYTTVGNGGFGPGFGLHGIPASMVHDDDNLLDRYLNLRKGGKWPERLLPICEWGSGIYSSIDCSDPAAAVIRHDPNMQKADELLRIPKEKQFDRSGKVPDACWVESPSFEAWLQEWVNGKKLFYAAYSTPTVEDDEEIDEDAEDIDEE